jgi:hypothetical protein
MNVWRTLACLSLGQSNIFELTNPSCQRRRAQSICKCLGLTCPELGYANLEKLRTARGKLGLPIERDRHFDADKSISAYADESRTRGHIVT